jgi:hypothetical protein
MRVVVTVRWAERLRNRQVQAGHGAHVSAEGRTMRANAKGMSLVEVLVASPSSSSPS